MAQSKSALAASVKTASRGQAAFVFASATDKVPKSSEELVASVKEFTYAPFECKACTNVIQANANSEPFCIVCGAGDEMTKLPVDANAKTELSASADMVALDCATCSHTTFMETAVVAAVVKSAKGTNPIHCSVCSTPMIVDAKQLEADMTPTNVPESDKIPGDGVQPGLTTPDVPPEPKVTAGSEDGALNFGDDAGEGAEDGDVSLDNLAGLDGLDAPPAAAEGETDEFGQSIDSNTDTDELVTPGGAVPPESFAAPTPEDGGMDGVEAMELEPFSVDDVPIMSDADEMPNDDYDGDGTPDFEAEETLAVNDNEEGGEALVDALDMDDTEMALAYVKANNRLVAMKGHVAIASLDAGGKSVNAKFVDSPALITALRASIKQDGLRTGLTAMGFTLIKTPVAASKASVTRKAEALTAGVKKQFETQQAVFAESFALAAAGMNRGGWKGKKNVLKEAMIAELTRAGVQTPKTIASAIFDEVGMQYAKDLLLLANTATKLSSSARKELAQVLNLTANTDPGQELEDMEHSSSEVAPSSQSVEARMSGGAAPGARKVPVLLRATGNPQAVEAASQVLFGDAKLEFNF